MKSENAMQLKIGGKDHIADAAAWWIAREMSGSITPQERAELARWANDAPAHRRALDEMRRILSAIDNSGEEILEREFERELEEFSHESREAHAAPVYKIAASIVAAAMIGAFAAFGFPALNRPAQIAVADFSTRTGEINTVELKDGSKVELNTASKIEVRFTKKERHVELAAGGGFFEVAKNEVQPFIVKTEKATVTVTGTSFNVSAYDSRTIVQVLSGSVKVEPLNGGVAMLTAGRMVEIDAAGRIGPIADFDPAIAFGWRHGKLQFRETPLPAAIASLNRYFDKPIQLTGYGAEDLQVTGDFDIYDRDTAVEALALIFDLEIEDAGSTLRLRNSDDEGLN